MWRMRRLYVTRRVHPTLGEAVSIPTNVYRYMRHVAFNAIMLHQARLRAVVETPPRLPPKQYILQFV